MNGGKRSMRSAVVVSLAGSMLGLGIVALSPLAMATGAADDCARVASTDRTLCRKVQLQHAYGAAYGDGGWTSPSGKVIVHRITHGGYSKAQMREQLASEADDYRLWVTGVPVDMDAIVSKCGDHKGQWVVDFVKRDGVHMTRKRVVCS